MTTALENMTKKQLQALVLEQEKKFHATKQEVLAAQKKIQEKENHIEAITKEKESLLKKLQEMLEKFSSMKFELSQLKRLIFGSKMMLVNKCFVVRPSILAIYCKKLLLPQDILHSHHINNNRSIIKNETSEFTNEIEDQDRVMLAYHNFSNYI